MDKSIYFVLWGGMYILCCVLGFLPEQTGFSLYVMTAVSLLFFLPPFLLVRKAKEKNDTKTLKLTRRICLISLGLSTLMLVANFLSVLSPSETLGNVLHVILSLVSVPMMSSGLPLVSLFLWACLLSASKTKAKK
jgi:hypothetical protein